jgi:hypothetical protein
LPESRPRGLERLELRVERLRLTFRLTFAFHAREVRFEIDAGEGFERVFPETFSFHSDRHDPAELVLQLDDLMNKSRLLSPNAHRRDSRELMTRLLAEAPRYLEKVLEGLESDGKLAPKAQLRLYQDLALLSQIFDRFIETRDLIERRSVRVAAFLLRKLTYHCLLALMHGRVDPAFLEAYIAGTVDPVDPSDDPSESGFFHILEQGDADACNRMIVRMAERAFFLWLEGVCLDLDNQAFEKEDSPFSDRESEVLGAVIASGSTAIHTGRDLSPFLRRPSRDCARILAKLEGWFLRRYDIRHSSALINHAAAIERGEDDAQRTLSWQTPRLHAVALALLAAPLVLSAFLYDLAPSFFDALCSAEVVVVNAAAIWFLAYRFCWKRDLTFFHAAVPRIGAGIIVGYLPVFLIDEVWDLASRSGGALVSVATLLGLVTLLYIFVEVQGKLGDASVAFGRARAIFVLGVMQAFAFGVVMTSMVGRFMVSRNWPPEVIDGELVGQLPRVVGLVEPFTIFPSAVLIMTFLSFFIGVFLQLMWEELPITEPL